MNLPRNGDRRPRPCRACAYRADLEQLDRDTVLGADVACRLERSGTLACLCLPCYESTPGKKRILLRYSGKQWVNENAIP